MLRSRDGGRWIGLWFLLASLAVGCVHTRHEAEIPATFNERNKASLPEYIIEPPDILQIDLLYAVPLPPYHIQPMDLLALTVTNTPAADPIAGVFPVDPDGTVALGGRYGNVTVAGMTMNQARTALEKHLSTILKDAKVSLSIAQGRGAQLVRGPHIVRPDGTVALGNYGSVRVSGLTLTDAKKAIEAALAKSLQSPEVVVNVIGYNSKVYYVVFNLGGAGQQLIRLPVTGNDTVLDAISQVNGLSSVSDPRKVWVARSAGPGEASQVLPVDWHGITKCGRAESNYQLFPGDRLYVQAYPLVSTDTQLARVLNPIERLLGFSLLGGFTIQQLKFNNNNGGGVGGVP
jgi:polysaccharide export outer membrane protein